MSLTKTSAPDARTEKALTVYYDGACPLCAKEIATYRSLQGADSIEWIDASRCQPEELGAELDRSAALARLHARSADGALIDGVAAFAALWQRLPAFARLGRLASQPLVLPLLGAAYSGFLRVRRLWRAPVTALPHEMVVDLRTDHAGETGATMIYRGILAVTRDDDVRLFARRHLATEARHLTAVEAMLAAPQRSRLLPLWRLGGWLIGALPAVAGPHAVYATIETVETFVDRHYAAQLAKIDRLDPDRRNPSLQALWFLVDGCRTDEVAHRDEAAAKRDRPLGIMLRTWIRLIGIGSAAAVSLSRRF